jgi:cytochrome bd ubiquinol oxidase subunit II
MAFIPFWFVLITILWTGFFVLEGFDMGVGMLNVVVGRDEAGRRAVINTIGPLWDGNEVWLIVAGAAMFAAFPGWYATMFSGLYLAVLVLLCALIVRGVSFEYRGKSTSERWRSSWSWLLSIGSLLAPFLIGLALGDLLNGLPIGADHEYTGTFWDLFTGYGVFAGIALVAICLLHGAIFITLKTVGDVRFRAAKFARRFAPVTALLTIAFVSWTHVTAGGGGFLNVIEFLTILAVLAAWALVTAHRDGWAFAATTTTIGLSIITLFVDLYPRVMVSSTNRAYSLTVYNSASGEYTLKVMTVVGLVLLPIVLAYQAWTYYVFRRRITDQSFQPALGAAPRPAVSAAVGMTGQASPEGHGASAAPPAAQPARHGLLRRSSRGTGRGGRGRR